MGAAKVAIAGGSIGGLTAALLLRDLGMDVTVHERSGVELEQRGAGIGFLPDAARYLVDRAGIVMDRISTTTDVIRYLDRRGGVTEELQHTYRFSSWNTVYRCLLGVFGRQRYRLGSEVTGRAESPDHVNVRYADGPPQDVDLLVCADGVGSSFRQQLLPGTRRQYAGYVAWRGMVPESDLSRSTARQLGEAITYYVYANSHLLMYPIPGSDGSVSPGHRLINFVWYRNYLPGPDLDDLLTDTSGGFRQTSLPPGTVRGEHVRELHAVAVARLPSIATELVQAATQPFLQVVFDVEVEQMAFGRTCLIGDAGFVARPHAAAGTAKASADAWALAEALAQHRSVPQALTAWEPGQLALGRQLLDRTRRLGERSQVSCSWDPRDPETLFRLRQEGP